MDTLFNGKSLFMHLLAGLVQYNDQDGSYPYPTSLQYALNRLSVIAALHQESVPTLEEWFERFGERLERWWRGDLTQTLPDEDLGYIRLWTEYGLNSEVWEYVDEALLSSAQGATLQEELDQQPIRELLTYARTNSQRYGGQYTRVRRFMIEHPVLTNWELRDGLNALDLDSDVEALLRQAYCESRPDECYKGQFWRCPHCGSLLHWRGDKPHCVGHHICGRLTNGYQNRQPVQTGYNATVLCLKRGLVRRVCLAGKTEIALFDRLVGLLGASNVALYPYGDQYDIEIRLGAETWAIDVKDYTSPRHLARILREEFPKQQGVYKPTWTHFLYVVPDYRLQWNQDYCAIVSANFTDAAVCSESQLIQKVEAIAKRR